LAILKLVKLRPLSVVFLLERALGDTPLVTSFRGTFL